MVSVVCALHCYVPMLNRSSQALPERGSRGRLWYVMTTLAGSKWKQYDCFCPLIEMAYVLLC